MIELRTGDILHCRGKGIVSRLIRAFTKSPYSHTATVVVIVGETYIIDSQRKGTHLKPYHHWLKSYGYRYHVSRVLGINKEEFTRRALSKADMGYDYKALLLRHPLALIKKRWRKQAVESDKMVCSEYVAWAHRFKDWFKMTPKKMRQYCLDNTAIIENFENEL